MTEQGKSVRLRLTVLSFMVFAVWGSYLTSVGSVLMSEGFGTRIGWFFASQGVLSLFTPALAGMVADRWVPAQKLLGICQAMFGLLMGGAGVYALTAAHIDFWVLFGLYAGATAFFMPSIGLANSVAFSVLRRAGQDTVRAFPRIRVWGTVGFVCAMLFVNFTQFQTNARQLVTAAVVALLTAVYAFTLPDCPPGGERRGSVLRSLGMLRNRQVAVFLAFSVLTGVALQITNSFGNVYISSFARIAEYADTWGAHNANALFSVSQVSEALCILLIPLCMRRFGVKNVILISMLAWALRFLLLGIGDTGQGLWMLVASCVVYGVAFDFFNIAGGIYMDSMADKGSRASAQGLFMAAATGIGGSCGILIAQRVVNALVFSAPTPEAQHAGWVESWLVFAAYMAVVALMFALLFRPRRRQQG